MKTYQILLTLIAIGIILNAGVTYSASHQPTKTISTTRTYIKVIIIVDPDLDDILPKASKPANDRIEL